MKFARKEGLRACDFYSIFKKPVYRESAFARLYLYLTCCALAPSRVSLLQHYTGNLPGPYKYDLLYYNLETCTHSRTNGREHGWNIRTSTRYVYVFMWTRLFAWESFWFFLTFPHVATERAELSKCKNFFFFFLYSTKLTLLRKFLTFMTYICRYRKFDE